MNANSSSADNTITLRFAGHLTVDRQDFDAVLRHLPVLHSIVQATGPLAPPVQPAHQAGKPERLAYTMRETAELLGVSYITVHRLIQRGLLRASLALRCKVISKKEIERFLAVTTDGVDAKKLQGGRI